MHALGPAWQDYDARSPDFFPAVGAQIKRTVFGALVVAEQLRATGVTLPAISGGIFCHQPFDPASHGLNHKEQMTARRQLLQVTLPVGVRLGFWRLRLVEECGSQLHVLIAVRTGRSAPTKIIIIKSPNPKTPKAHPLFLV